jgi:SAM-dependent methyltransferase
MIPGMDREAAFACLVCGAARGRQTLRRGGLVLLTCEACGFVQLDPVPSAEQMLATYAEETHYVDALESAEKVLLPRDRRVLADLAARGATGPLLDVGAGAGFLLRAALERGWEAIGLELSRPSLERMRGRVDATLYGTDIEHAPLAPESVGVVTLSHSLEHVRDPVGTLRRAREALRPGGLVFVAVPNWRAGARVVLNGEIAWVNSGHVSYFARDTLARAFREAGLEPVAFDSQPFMGVDYGLALDFVRKLRLERPTQRFLHMGSHPLNVLWELNANPPCPVWRLRAVIRTAHALLFLWPESLCVALGRGQELRGIARRPA